MSWSALILAGSRGGGDPVAEAAGLSHKAFVRVGGRPMIERVVRALRAVPSIARVAIVLEEPRLRDLPGLRPLFDKGWLSLLPQAASPSVSLLQGLEALADAAPGPVLATTADNCLLEPPMIEHFLAAVPDGADAVAAMARAEVIGAAYPETARTYMRFSDGARSGCNLFAFPTTGARRVLAFWQRIEQDRKRPLAMARLLGPTTLARYAAGTLSLDQALRALERKTGTRLAVVEMPYAEAAIDVDKAADLALAEAILRLRETR